MVNLKSRIVITSKTTGGVIEFDFCNDISTSSTWQDMTQKARFVIPRKLQFEGVDIFAGTNPLIKRGDSIKIYLGYEPYEVLEFEGFITGVNPSLPIEIECEDAMWLFKQMRLNKSFSKGTKLKVIFEYIMAQYKLSDVYKEIKQDVSFEALDTALGQFIIDNATPVQVFEELRKTYGFTTFLRNNKIYCGLAYYPMQRKEHEFEFQDNIIESSMQYKREEDTRIQVVAISISSVEKTRGVGFKNERTKVTVGDGDGAIRTFHFYGLSEVDLKKAAEREIVKLKYTGFYGSFLTFGEPSVKHGDGVIIKDNLLPEKNGTYLVKKVDKHFGLGGYRQDIELDIKIA